MMTDKKKIAFVVQLPKYVSPGQRFRFEQFEPLLQQNGFVVDTYPFLDEKAYQVLYKEGHTVQKVRGVLKGFLLRMLFLFQSLRYDFIYLQREAAPIGPPVFEWILVKLLRRRLILDFDDAIWLPNVSVTNRLARYLKCFWKVKYLCKWSYKVTCGNDFLCSYAHRYNERVIRIPTVVDTENRYGKLKKMQNGRVVIGWTGSHSTIKYLYLLVPVLQQLETELEFDFLVIADRQPNLPLKNLVFVKWSADTEIDDLLRMDIGIMPLTKDQWSEGKCGFKLIQYLALGIPAVASPIGVNTKIIEGGESGFLCRDEAAWKEALAKLVMDAALRKRMGAAGQKKIVMEYSLGSVKNIFLNIFT